MLALAEALRRYLESGSSTLESLQLGGGDREGDFFEDLVLSDILEGLIQSPTVTDVSFLYWQWPKSEDGVEENSFEERAKLVANFLRSKRNLSTLRLQGCQLFQFQAISTSMGELLMRRDTSLRCLDLDLNYYVGEFLTIPEFHALLTDVTKSTRLEQFVFGVDESAGNWSEYYRIFTGFIPSFKVKEITLQAEYDSFGGDDEQLLFDAFKDNYSIETVNYTWGTDNEEYARRLPFFLDRNRKLALWTKNPTLVPRDLWAYAMELALKAGHHALYRSLLALSGEGIGLPRKVARKL